MGRVIVKAVALWLALAALAVGNAAVRELVLAPALAEPVALPMSGLLLSGLIFTVAWFTAPWFRQGPRRAYATVGAVWFFLTLIFEVGLISLTGAQALHELARAFDIASGNLFVLTLLSCLVSPWIGAKMRGYR